MELKNTADVLVRILEAMKHARGEDKARSILTHVKVDVHSDAVSFTATNGRILAKVTLGKPKEASIDSEWRMGLAEGSYLASADAVERAIALCKLEKKAKRGSTVVGLEVTPADGEGFPDTQGVIGEGTPVNGADVLWFDPELVTPLMACAKRLECGEVRFNVRGPFDAMRLDAYHERFAHTVRFIGLVMPLRPTDVAAAGVKASINWALEGRPGQDT